MYIIMLKNVNGCSKGIGLGAIFFFLKTIYRKNDKQNNFGFDLPPVLF